MICGCVFYPPSNRVDLAHSCERHLPMAKARLGPARTGLTVDAGLVDVVPGASRVE